MIGIAIPFGIQYMAWNMFCETVVDIYRIMVMVYWVWWRI